jgi:hypothetical protein
MSNLNHWIRVPLKCVRENWDFDLQVEQSASEQMPRRGICQ